MAAGIKPQTTSLVNLSVEEENLSSIPFAVLERRFNGRQIDKLDVRGTKTLPDGSEVQVLWQVQGDNELGLPSEKDLDIFVALGVLTFRNNFEKTVTFNGRELAKMLNTQVNGKFYDRLKLAMGRLIALRFRAVLENEKQETVKWVNVFQETSFAVDKVANRCTGSVTWTDKLIQSMGSGFFRLIDASRYMQLDGITAKHLYRFLSIAFEKTDTLFIDARKLATDHLGMPHPPQYLSRLMQTLEPAFEQVKKIGVLGEYHVASAPDWRIALRRHASYVPERKALMMSGPGEDPELNRAACRRLLEEAGFTPNVMDPFLAAAISTDHFYSLERGARLVTAMIAEGVVMPVALSLVRRAFESLTTDPESMAGRDQLDWCEIALHVVERKKQSKQTLRNAGGLLVKIVKDPLTRSKFVDEHAEAQFKTHFRRREDNLRRLKGDEEERILLLEYEEFRQAYARQLMGEMADVRRQVLLGQKLDELAKQERFERMTDSSRRQEAESALVQDIARAEVPGFDKWLLRRRARQSVMPFMIDVSSLSIQ